MRKFFQDVIVEVAYYLEIALSVILATEFLDHCRTLRILCYRSLLNQVLRILMDMPYLKALYSW